MYFCVSAIRPLPELWITHGSQEITDLLRFVFASSLYLKSIDLLQNLSLFVQEQTQGYFLLLLL